MSTPAQSSGSKRTFGAKQLLTGLALIALGAIAAVAVLREVTRAPSNSGSAATVGNAYAGTVPRPARTAAEESYATGLWPIHEIVQASAVRMTFAGLSYKMGEIDKVEVKKRVAPLSKVFEQAQVKFDALPVPASMQTQHEQYAEALRLYRNASTEMVKVAQDGKEEHLVKAQAMSYSASENLLRVGDVLWPGEHRPN